MPGNFPESDDELIAQAYHGDRDAFGRLYERYLKQIYRYVYFRVGNVHEAEDLTDTVFIKAWEALPTIVPHNFKVQAWLYRIAHNLVIDRFRTLHPDGSLDTLNEAHADGSSPEERYETNENTQDLARHITMLDPLLQEVLICRFVLGYSHSETADIMNRSVVYIRVLQHRALRKLKDLLDEEFLEDDGHRNTDVS